MNLRKYVFVLVVLVFLAAILSGGAAWALDEAVLTPTNDKKVAAEEHDFDAAMGIWFRHRYAEGEKMLKEYSKKNANSRWKAEADLHIGCYQTYLGQYDDAKKLFRKLASETDNKDIRAKANIRLGAIAVREAKHNDAIAYFTGILKTNPTWDQFKYANYNARKLIMTAGKQEARINCGPVALAVCLDALGKKNEASAVRGLKVSEDGTSLAVLEAEAKQSGVIAQAVGMTIDELKNTALPVLAYVNPTHFIAILSVKDDKFAVEDSIHGKYEMSLDELSRSWGGSALIFAQNDKLKKLALLDAIETVGGCCGQIDEDECLGDPCACQQTGSGGTSPGGPSGCAGCDSGGSAGIASAGRPTWSVNVDNLNILVKDTPVFYNPGKGPNIAFTLTYSNENSNTGIFGRGWRSPYDMKVFYLPATVYVTTAISQDVTTSSPANTESLSVTSTYEFPDSGAIMLASGQNAEVITYSSKTSDSFQGITRGPVPISAASESVVDMHTPSLQVHLNNGRIETYIWNNSDQKYAPRNNYGYRDSIGYSAGKIVYSLRSGGKYHFMPEGGPAEGRTSIIEDNVGNQVTCSYDANGCLDSVTDANGGATDIITTGAGIFERVTNIRIPRLVNGQWVLWSNDTDPNRRQAELGYSDGNLVSIKDMLGDTSTLDYNALLASSGAQQFSAYTYLTEDVTTSFPANGGSLSVSSTAGFLPSGKIKINDDEVMSYTNLTANEFTGISRASTPKSASQDAPVVQVVETTLQSDITSSSPADEGQLDVVSTAGFPNSGYIAVQCGNNTETIHYTGKTSTAFTGITRGNPAYAATASTSSVWFCMQTPYLSEIVTPSKKTKFDYEWFYNSGNGNNVIGLHEIRECGPTENYPSVATIHYAWASYRTKETRYPTSVTAGGNGGSDHWTGGLTKVYDFTAFYDASTSIRDELGNLVVEYGYNGLRDRTSITDANGNITQYIYSPDKDIYAGDGKHDMYFRRDPLSNEWAYTYNADHSLHTETDPYGNLAKTYTYNSAGQVTQIDTPLGTQLINHYDSLGRLDYTTNPLGKTTNYHYNENSETRGLLTSVHDPDDKATLYHYDTNGRKDQVTDPNGSVTRYFYDDLDRVTKVIYGSADTDPFTETKYTCCHKIYEQDQNGRRVYYVYDAKVRPYKTIASAKSTTLATSITTTVPANSGDLEVASVAGFPSVGKIVVLDEVISYTGRDTTNNLFTGITRGADGTRCVDADSDCEVGCVDSVQATYGYHLQYLDRMVSLTDAANHTTYYEYYDNGKQKSIRYPDDKGERYSYASNNSGVNMTKKEYGTFSGTYPDQTFTPTDSLTVNYEYDANNRLLRTYH
ncbi:MAG: cysteine peptidase family C39 domain-containing protein [Armatimonadetes bacterium]|nr:cysteine peptidase family C39 domain-containing protein [Armatimonadota bacterium]